MSLKIHLRIDEIEILCWRGLKKKVFRKLLRVSNGFSHDFGGDVLFNVTNILRKTGKELKDH